jgi:[acyl-carrier-protein] S-malonyltransferase
LKRTDVSQPAITLANLAAAQFLEERGVRPWGCAGFSLGEYAALVVSGVLSAEDCFRLVNARGKAMQASADRLARQGGTGGDGAAGANEAGGNGDKASGATGGGLGGPAGMAAVIGLLPEKVEALIAEWAAEKPEIFSGLFAANINSKKQTVVSGTGIALSQAEALFKQAGARRFIRLAVAGPFHSPLIADAAAEFAPILEKAEFRDPVLPLYSNVTGKRVASGPEAKWLALLQITSPVRWVDEEAAIMADEVDAVYEAGPGHVLAGLWRDTGSEIACFAAGNADEVLSNIGK